MEEVSHSGQGMKNIKGYTLKELRELFTSMDEKSFRADQIFRWLWVKGAEGFEQMTDISKALRERLKNEFYISSLEPAHVSTSRDGSIKYLFKLEDGETIESVFIPEGKRRTVCVSTQVGCGMGCKFCATGKIGLIRNLSFYEIADQVLSVQKITGERITNVVLMGMGEPFANLDEVLKALRIINKHIGIGARKITVSTAGIVPGIKRFAETPFQYKLAISLNAAIQGKREKIMPVAKAYTINDIMDALDYYYSRKHLRVTFEYVLFKNFNDSEEDAEALGAIASRVPSKINIIPYNQVEGFPYESPDEDDVNRFAEYLYPIAPAVTIRWSRGRDVHAACGQLRGMYT